MFSSIKTRNCKHCNVEFKVRAPTHLFCSRDCQMKYWIANNLDQYKQARINYKLAKNNDWIRAIKSLIYKKSRRHLNVNDLFALLEKQNYCCALSGEELTCVVKEGEISRTNLSIDRIDRTKGYELGNIRFVCMVVNTMRWVMSDEELYYWCENILNNRKIQLKESILNHESLCSL